MPSSGVDFPVQTNQLARIEKQNDIFINVFRLNEEEKVYPFRLGTVDTLANASNIVNLLELTSVTGNHYVLITSLTALLRRQLNLSRNPRYICPRDLFSCQSQAKFIRHQELCRDNSVQAVSLPRANCPRKSDKFAYIKDRSAGSPRVTEFEVEMPFCFYSDIECVLPPISTAARSGPETPSTLEVTTHEPSCMAYSVTRWVY